VAGQNEELKQRIERDLLFRDAVVLWPEQRGDIEGRGTVRKMNGVGSEGGELEQQD